MILLRGWMMSSLVLVISLDRYVLDRVAASFREVGHFGSSRKHFLQVTASGRIVQRATLRLIARSFLKQSAETAPVGPILSAMWYSLRSW